MAITKMFSTIPWPCRLPISRMGLMVAASIAPIFKFQDPTLTNAGVVSYSYKCNTAGSGNCSNKYSFLSIVNDREVNENKSQAVARGS